MGLAESECVCFTFAMGTNASRRNFLRTAPIAAAAGFALSSAAAQAADGPGEAQVPFQVFPAKTLEADAAALQAKPGNHNLLDGSAGFPCGIVMTTEATKSAKEFEWHEGRDHIVQILDGATLYEVGGTPKDTHKLREGEWLAPVCEGSKAIVLTKGDMLVIPRGVPHKRSTGTSVTFLLLSPMGAMKT